MDTMDCPLRPGSLYRVCVLPANSPARKPGDLVPVSGVLICSTGGWDGGRAREVVEDDRREDTGEKKTTSKKKMTSKTMSGEICSWQALPYGFWAAQGFSPAISSLVTGGFSCGVSRGCCHRDQNGRWVV